MLAPQIFTVLCACVSACVLVSILFYVLCLLIDFMWQHVIVCDVFHMFWLEYNNFLCFSLKCLVFGWFLAEFHFSFVQYTYLYIYISFFWGGEGCVISWDLMLIRRVSMCVNLVHFSYTFLLQRRENSHTFT